MTAITQEEFEAREMEALARDAEREREAAEALEAIRAFLVEHPMTHGQLATELGVAENTVTRWLNGRLAIGNGRMILRALRDLARQFAERKAA